jgi:hypothetical protein
MNESKLEQLYEQVYLGDMLTDPIAEYVALVTAYNEAHGLVPQAEYDATVQSTLSIVEQRAAFLQTTSLLGE